MKASRLWMKVGTAFLPFADAATAELPLARLLRLSLFQVTVGMATVLLIGTLNRVMIVELGIAAWLVAAMVAIPLVLAPFRALVGFRSDTHRSFLGWRRVPYLWMGTLLQFGGLSLMPFALVLLSGDTTGPAWVGHAGAALAFLLVGAGMQTAQTAGLALATDLAPRAARPRVVALMSVTLLVGMVASGLAFGALLADFSAVRLIQVVQGAAVVTMVLNGVALWKQEPRAPSRTDPAVARPAFRDAWRRLAGHTGALRFLVVTGLGTAAFNMQDIVLEPYGGEILGLGVAATTALTALMAGGALAAFALAARRLDRGTDPHRLAAAGVLVGVGAFSAVIFAEPLASAGLFRAGVAGVGFGGGLFVAGTLIAAMQLDDAVAGSSTAGPSGGVRFTGTTLGAWGAVQATAAGLAIASGGALRDLVSAAALDGRLGAALMHAATGYSFVYHVEMLLLFATLAALGPLVRRRDAESPPRPASPATLGFAAPHGS